VQCELEELQALVLQTRVLANDPGNFLTEDEVPLVVAFVQEHCSLLDVGIVNTLTIS